MDTFTPLSERILVISIEASRHLAWSARTLEGQMSYSLTGRRSGFSSPRLALRLSWRCSLPMAARYSAALDSTLSAGRVPGSPFIHAKYKLEF